MTSTHPIDVGVAIVGAGPIGIETAIAMQRTGADYILFEANQIGHAITKWPPQTRFFSSNEHVALAGVPVQNISQQSITGERYLAYLRMLVEMFDLNLHLYEPISHLQKEDGYFSLTTQPRAGETHYHARHVVLTTGGMAAPNLLHIPGEDLPHVTHYFPGPHPYFRTRVLIVGGKNSAMEAALRCWRGGARHVAISYRRPQLDFDRIKPHLAVDIQDRLRKGEIDFFGSTLPVEIAPTAVALATTSDGVTPNGSTRQHPADFVILATGFVADMSLFRGAGVTLLGREQAPKHNPETMETDVPGLYVAGTAVGGTQFKFKHFISTTHDHVAKVVQAITGRTPQKLGTIPPRNNAVTYEEVKAN